MSKLMKVLALCLIVDGAMAVDVRLFMSVVGDGSIPWTGSGGPYSPTQIGTGPADGGLGAHVYTTDTVGVGSFESPSPDRPLPTIQTGGTLAIWARVVNNTAQQGSTLGGMNLKLLTTGDLVLSTAWTQWRNGTGPTASYRWEPSSDFVGSEVTLVGGLGGAGRGWQFSSTSSDRLDDYTLRDTVLQSGNAEMLLGYVRAESGVGTISLRLGRNGIWHSESEVRAAFGFGTTYIDAGVGEPDRGYSYQAYVVPEPAVGLMLALAAGLLRSRR